MLKGDEIFIGQGAHGKVYNNGDGTVTKVVQFHKKPYEELLPALYKGRKSIEGVAKALSMRIDYHGADSGTVYIIKEEINETYDVLEKIVKLESLWENALINTNNLFDFIEGYLKGGHKTQFRKTRSVEEFTKYVTLCFSNYLNALHDLIDIVEELKAEGIYNVDWNVENFGVRASTSKLTMFELGEAKYKKK